MPAVNNSAIRFKHLYLLKTVMTLRISRGLFLMWNEFKQMSVCKQSHDMIQLFDIPCVP